MFLCVPLALASQKERRQQLIIFHVWNIIFSEFILFSSLAKCKEGKIYRLLKVYFD